MHRAGRPAGRESTMKVPNYDEKCLKRFEPDDDDDAGTSEKNFDPSGTYLNGGALSEKGCNEGNATQDSETNGDRSLILLEIHSDPWNSDYSVYFCPLSHSLFIDPVIAEDGQTYEREIIERWFNECEQQGRPLVSPWTRLRIDRRLTENELLKIKIRQSAMVSDLRDFSFGLYLPHAKKVSNILTLRKIYSYLDELPEIMEETQKDWDPPIIAVIGEESSGKSSILERLSMMSIFPSDINICTTVPIYVRMRYAKESTPPTIGVYDMAKKKYVEGPFILPSRSGSVEVRTKMKEMLLYCQQERTQKSPKADDRHVVLIRLQGPRVATVDIVDFPGLLTFPKEKKDSTREFVENHIKEFRDSTIFLAVVPAEKAPNTSLALPIVYDNNIHSRTIGVFTKCDDVMSRTADYVENFKKRLWPIPPEGVGAFPLSRNGWVATMNAPLKNDQDSGFWEEKSQSASAESDFFRTNMPDLVQKSQATCDVLVSKIQDLFHQQLIVTWAPNAVRILKKTIHQIKLDLALLGMPASHESTENLLVSNEVKGLCVAAAFDLIDKNIQILIDGCYCEVLEPMKKKVIDALAEHAKGCRPSGLTASIQGRKDCVQAICQEAIVSWRSYLRAQVDKVLSCVVSMPTDYKEQCKVIDEPPFQLSRFPAFLQKIVENLVLLFAQSSIEVLNDVSKFQDLQFDVHSPSIEFRCVQSNLGPSISLELNKSDFSERIAFIFTRHSTQILQGKTFETILSAAECIESGDWIENCASKRKSLCVEIKRCQRALEGIIDTLGFESIKQVPIFIEICKLEYLNLIYHRIFILHVILLIK